MEKLKRSELFGAALVPVTGALVERYNKCLSFIGTAPTELRSFHIDAIGWSPEIADEKDDFLYLNSGESNPNAIILSPKQNEKPAYSPFHSFDKDIMHHIFKKHADTIKDITRDAAICVDLDQYIDAFYEPEDLLKYNQITVDFSVVDDLYSVQQQQLKLVEEFHEEGNFLDETLHLKILASARKHGDLRSRTLQMKQMNFLTTSFYTRAFGGVFVLRRKESGKNILIFESKVEADKVTTSSKTQAFHIEDGRFFSALAAEKMIVLDVEHSVNSGYYERVQKIIFSKHLKDATHSLSEILENSNVYKRYLNRFTADARKQLMILDRLQANSKKANALDIEGGLTQEVLACIQIPTPELPMKEQELVWKLIVKTSPYKDPLFLYWYDKETFYKEYIAWDESYQDWVIKLIKQNTWNS
ncbi:hypothetical protein IMCC3317_20730 [Kordia antarctica]|uniref:Uncharacterized protein n=1 Tax=Kordia antarctica TaxID=1218801 RepID=A0A7L4ZIZ4_9FLAO|nr:DUF6638 family protein [Kordia antarctica]QHI36708.1 hypothetical protein IMCC3317_20730 [Kordia antarctica]